MHDHFMSKKAVSLPSRSLPKKKAIVPSVAVVVGDEAALCTEHHVHAKALLLEPLEVPEAQRMAEFFAALADATRLRLLSLLAVEECCVCDLAERLGMTESAISHQLRALRAARLVSYRKEGRQVFYRLHDHHVVELYRTVQEHLAE
jgi:DNA-binding transcriptional ArsR family regulator